MRFLAVSLHKDWARVRRDPAQFLTALGIPLVLGILMTLVFGRQPVTPRGLLLVTDEDNGAASMHILDAFHKDPLARMVTIEKVTRDAGRARISQGEASAYLFIPKGFQRAILFNVPFHLQLFTNPAQSILPRMIESALSMTVDGIFYLRRANFSPALNVPLIDLETSAAHAQQPRPSFAAVFLPSMFFMGMLFIASGTAADIWKEKMQGTLRRVACSPVSMARYLAARVVFVVLLYTAVSVLGLLAVQQLAGMPVPDFPAAALWIVFTGANFYLLFLWISVQPATPRAAAVLTNLVIFPLAMLGGCFFPFEWMPGWMAAIGKLTPNGWAITQFKTILNGSADLTHMAISTASLGAVGALAFILTLRRLKGGFVL